MVSGTVPIFRVGTSINNSKTDWLDCIRGATKTGNTRGGFDVSKVPGV